MDILRGLTDWTLKQRRSYAIWVLIVAIGCGASLLWTGEAFPPFSFDFLWNPHQRQLFLMGTLIGGGIASAVHLADHLPFIRRLLGISFSFFYCLILLIGLLTFLPYYIYNLIRLITLSQRDRSTATPRTPTFQKRKEADWDPWD